MRTDHPISALFKKVKIGGNTASGIMDELGKWAVRNLAYADGTGCNPGYLFRGELNYLRPLCSKLERATGSGSLLENETKRYLEFVEGGEGRNLASVTLGAPPSRNDIWQWLALMQHYGYPTRLIDFTPDIRVALFFALGHYEDYKNCPGVKPECDAPPALVIYCFPCRDLTHEQDGQSNKSPFKPIPSGTDLNLAFGTLIDKSWFGPHLSRWDQDYKPCKVKNWGWDRPYFPNPRLRAQHGMFVYPFDDLSVPQPRSQDVSWLVNCLAERGKDPFCIGDAVADLPGTRLIIPVKHAGNLMEWLAERNITEHAIYAGPKRWFTR